MGRTMRGLAAFFLAFLLLTGCAHVQTVSISPHQDLSRHAINRYPAGKVADLTLKNGMHIRVRHVILAADSTSYLDAVGGRPWRVPTRELSELEYLGRTEGAVTGMAAGLLGGALIGGLIGLAAGDDPEGEFLALSAEDKAGIFGGLLGVAGAIGYGIYGGTRGARYIYRFEISNQE